MADFKYQITKEDEGLTLKKVLKKHFDFSSRFLSKIKFQNLVKVNGKSSPLWYEVRENDSIEVTGPEESSDFPAEDIPINVIYEDEHMLIINKQPGVIVHPTKGHPIHTIANGLVKYMEDTSQNFKIRFVNRLDMDTSGLLVVAKDAYTQNELTKQMSKGQMKKEYKAVVKGLVESNAGTIDLPIGRPDSEKVHRAVMPVEDGGFPSITHYEVMQRFVTNSKDGEDIGFTLINLKLDTGRTHQIRVHMSQIGHPVLGDHLYGGDNILLIDRQALHASRLEFIHPTSKKPMNFESPLPDDIVKAIEKLNKY